MEGSVLRLFRFRPSAPGSLLDETLRGTTAPRLTAAAGLTHAWVGRHGPDAADTRLLASVWESRDAMTAFLGGDGRAGGTDDTELAELAHLVVDPQVEILPIAVHLPFDRPEPAGILRVFRGEVRDGLLESYTADVRSGTIADVEAGRGPLALFLGVASANRFVTVSAWTGWDVIEAATGGNVRQPVATRHANRLVGGTASHFEVLPEVAPAARRPATGT